jgi:hypothetical protein
MQTANALLRTWYVTPSTNSTSKIAGGADGKRSEFQRKMANDDPSLWMVCTKHTQTLCRNHFTFTVQ